MLCGVRLAADPQPRDARRQPRHRLADRRHARPCCSRSMRRVVLASRRGERTLPLARVLPRLPQDARSRPGRGDHGDRRCRRGAAAAGRDAPHGFVQGVEAARARHQHRRGGVLRRDATPTGSSATRGSPTAAWRATPVRARKAEALLVGKHAGRETPREALARSLGDEFTPIDDVRGSAAYRRGLVDEPVGEVLRGATSDAQDRAARSFEPRGDARGRPRRRVARARARERGRPRHRRARTTSTTPRSAGRCWRSGRCCAPHAHARILRRDATAARCDARASSRC